MKPFWEKPSSKPRLQRDKWQIQAKLALLAKEKITLDILLGPQPEQVKLSLESNDEDTIQVKSTQSEPRGLARIAELKTK